MDFAKFVDILATHQLWFSRLDHLNDPREGLHTDQEFASLADGPPANMHFAAKERLMGYVNCWCENERESMAMWDLYGQKGCGVAIKTTVSRLRVALSVVEPRIFCGRVRYLDWQVHDDDPHNVIAMWVRKSESYRHESEVRLVLWHYLNGDSVMPSNEVGVESGEPDRPIDIEEFARDVMVTLIQLYPQTDFRTVSLQRLVPEAIRSCLERTQFENAPAGISVNIDLPALISEIVIGPDAQPWQISLIRNVSQKYEVTATVRLSDLAMRRNVPR